MKKVLFVMFALISIQSYAQQKYNSSGTFSGGLAWVERNDKCGYIDKTGKMVIHID